MSFHGLFLANGLAFLISAVLIAATVLPAARALERTGGIWQELSFGIVSYMRTPRLRALLVLYVGVAAASAMVIVNTVIYVRDRFGGSDSETAVAFAATGAGSMLAAILLPKVLGSFRARRVMLMGVPLMALPLALVATIAGELAFLAAWFVAGIGMSVVQTPAGRVVNRSARPEDRPAYFSAQFALSHACWLFAYPLAGQLGSRIGLDATAWVIASIVVVSGVVAWRIWPRDDTHEIAHVHEAVDHAHLHTHDEHHYHEHDGTEGPEPHAHPHRHAAIRHRHAFVIDDHHAYWPQT